MLSPRQFQATYERTKEPGTGTTVNTQTGEFLRKGWAAAVPGHEHIEPTASYSPGTLRRHAETHRAALQPEGPHHLGVWHDPGHGAAYLDVSQVRPETYEGGVRTLADAYRGRAGLGGLEHHERSVYRMSKGHTLFTHAADEGEQQETAQAMKGLRKQQPKAKPLAEKSTKKLGKALRNRQVIQEG